MEYPEINSIYKRDEKTKRFLNEYSLPEFEYLKYYKTIFDGEIIEVGRFEPTSQTCSSCGHRQEISLKEREFICEECGLIIDRDLNASFNIKKLCIEKLNNTSGHGGIYAFGDTVRPLEIRASVVELGNYREAV